MSNMQYEIININDVTDNQLAAVFDMMSPQRQQRVLRLRRDEDRRRTLAAEMLARRLLCARFGAEPKASAIENAESGQPVLVGLPGYISLSHSGSWVMCALSDQPVGADIEIISDRGQGLLEKICSDEEQAYVLCSGQHDPIRFFRIWTAKEACLKRAGKGLSGGMEATVVANTSGMLKKADGCNLLSGQHENAVFAIAY